MLPRFVPTPLEPHSWSGSGSMEDPYRLGEYHIQKEMSWWVLYKGGFQQFMSQELPEVRAAVYRLLIGESVSV